MVEREDKTGYQSVIAELKKISQAIFDMKQGFIRTHRFYRYVSGTVGDVTVSTSIRFPDAGQTRSIRDHIRSGEILMVRIYNSGSQPAYVAFNHDASTDEPLVVPGGATHEFEIKQFDYLAICSTSASSTTTVRVSFWGD